MKKEKWLLTEIDSWQQMALIDEKTAEALKELYTQKKNINTMILLFSIIGALLIGAGVILIGAKNWEYFPIPLRIGIAFLPLLASQALAVFTVKVKYGSLAWRESVAIFATAAVFTVIAMVGQIFHLPGDYDTYVLLCGLLSLPMIYVLDAASPLLVYYWTVLNWAALDNTPINAPILLGLFAIGALFVYLKKNETSARLSYMIWVTTIAGFALVLIMGNILDCSLLLAALCYFVLLLSIDGLPEPLLAPFKIIGALGGLVTTAILTYEDMWSYLDNQVDVGGSVMIGVMLAAILFFAALTFKRDKLKFLFVTSLTFLCILRFLWAMFDLSNSPYDFMLMCVSNLLMLAVGISFIVYGIKKGVLLQLNIGMTAICALIVMRFFDSNMDFFWRGVVFLLLGTVFLLVNVKILRMKKQSKQGETI
jgi:uncharacterized membrane protein